MELAHLLRLLQLAFQTVDVVVQLTMGPNAPPDCVVLNTTIVETLQLIVELVVNRDLVHVQVLHHPQRHPLPLFHRQLLLVQMALAEIMPQLLPTIRFAKLAYVAVSTAIAELEPLIAQIVSPDSALDVPLHPLLRLLQLFLLQHLQVQMDPVVTMLLL
eukprot:NODE_31_length_37178_cov_0.413576.p26 type:complete len:159 gc:universal NODE_31_length_37178_cov_0.413576:25191-24715(-)